MARRPPLAPEIELKIFTTTNEIDRAITKLQRRITELDQLDLAAAVRNDTGTDDAAESSIRNTILEIYGPNSPEYNQHQHLDLWAGPLLADPRETVLARHGRHSTRHWLHWATSGNGG